MNNFKLDCFGLVCPMPVAKTKKMLNQMKSGDLLEVYGDFTEAGENIKRFVLSNGGKILNSKIDAGNYYLVIQKI